MSENARKGRRTTNGYEWTRMVMSLVAISVLCLVFICPSVLGAEKVRYHEDFEHVKIGPPPEEMMVLAGEFSVKEEAGNKFLELPGAPLDSFSIQFGPAETNSVTAGVTIRATSKGRRSPTFGVGLFGIAGYKLQVSPGKKAIELYRDQTLLGTVAYEWRSGEWLDLRLKAMQVKEGDWKVAGKVWQKGRPEPAAWMIAAEDKPEQAPGGRASIFGSPFAGTPIDFDDLVVE